MLWHLLPYMQAGNGCMLEQPVRELQSNALAIQLQQLVPAKVHAMVERATTLM